MINKKNATTYGINRQLIPSTNTDNTVHMCHGGETPLHCVRAIINLMVWETVQSAVPQREEKHYNIPKDDSCSPNLNVWLMIYS